jgi:hypothetical protein
LRGIVADEPVPSRRPNRPLAMVLLVLQVLATGALLVSSFLAFFEADRATGMKHFSYGVLVFLFVGWAARAALRPSPAQ